MSSLRQRLVWMLAGAVITGLGLAGIALWQPPGPAASVSAQSSVSLTDLETRFVDLYRQANGSVVSIQVVEEDGFGQGSGFVYDTAGHIVTNHHVAGEAVQISVVFANGTRASAELVGSDPDSDLAVIKVDPADAPTLKPLPLGDSDALQVGQMVVAIGNPFGLSGTMTTGIVSALGRSLPAQSTDLEGGSFTTPDIIQTDAAINPGNSGGPLLNLAGEMVGVNTAIRSSTSQNSGIGFAVPSGLVARVVPALIRDGSYKYPWLGIAGRTLDSATAEAMGLGRGQTGILVASISRNSPAQRAGLRGNDREVTLEGQTVGIGGDVIVSVDGQPLAEFDDLVHYLVTQASVGQTIRLGILRDGQTIEVPVTLAARP
ncbi:MAG: trypsin-like serine protease [Anaerolineae bacterium]|nr:trypsin-like serine protease [Anaerolineae bacterium]